MLATNQENQLFQEMVMTPINSSKWDRAEAEWLSPPEDDSEECHECGGFGTLPEKCEYCEGSGKVETGVIEPNGGAKELVPCEDCDGTGIFDEDCEQCEGHGNISRSQARRERAEAKADYDYQCYKDKKAEGDL